MNRHLKIAVFPIVIMVRVYRRVRLSWRLFAYDKRRFIRHAGVFHPESRSASIARIVMGYHVLEKGITMPRRHLDFGHAAVENLIELVETFEKRFPDGDGQVDHAIGCIKEYLQIHKDAGFDRAGAYWARLKAFCAAHPHVATACQRKCSRAEFYKDLNGPFPAFAASRHTVRHYSGMVPVDAIKRAVELAMKAPSACNRQYVKVYCISDHTKRDAIYALQNGNRGFGSDADKLLAVTADLSGIRWAEERNDAYTNAGIVLMNLSYALHYGKIAHCILNWSVHPQSDRKAHAILGIPEHEVIAALVACGNAPEEFLVASSPRKPIGAVFSEIV